MEYGLLHYPGDVTKADAVQPGRILGADAFDRPWVVGDVEYAPGRNQTDVHLRPAEPDDVRAELAHLTDLVNSQGQIPPVFRRPVQ